MAPTMLNHASVQEMVDAEPAGQVKKRMGSSFYRGENCNFNPYGSDHLNANYASQFLLKGWVPEQPFIDAGTKVTAFGSCFAENISHHLSNLGFDVSKNREKDIYISSMGDGLVNVHSILQQFRWALEGWNPPTNLWHDYDAKTYDLDEEVRAKTRKVFLETDVFILTFGLSEIWYDEVTGGVFWRAVPMKHYDATRHKFRACTFAETKAAIESIMDLVRKHVPSARIVVTLSPIPLIATFRPVSCITANFASKAIIRSALDEIFRERHTDGSDNTFYFPAFDVIMDAFPNKFIEDGRHLHPMIVPSIMTLFEAYYCKTNTTIEQAEQIFQQARLANVRTLLEHPLFREALKT